MNASQLQNWSFAALLSFGLLASCLTGCQTNIGGQTLPSAYFLKDDVQYYPAGPEDRLANQRRVLEEYKQRQLEVDEGILDVGN